MISKPLWFLKNYYTCKPSERILFYLLNYKYLKILFICHDFGSIDIKNIFISIDIIEF